MKNNSFKFLALFMIFFFMFNFVILFVPFTKGANFWISYIFSNIAILFQFIIGFICMKNNPQIEEKFFNIPMLKISFTYLIVQLFVSVLFMIFNEIPYWFNLVMDIVVWCLAMIGIILASATKDILVKFDNNMATKISYIPKICMDVRELARMEKDEITKGALNELVEKIRYSDSVSVEIVHDIENEIIANINKLKVSDNKLPLIESINNLIEKRNELCKITK